MIALRRKRESKSVHSNIRIDYIPGYSNDYEHHNLSLAFARMPRVEARGGLATGDRSVPRSGPSCERRKAGLASAEFRLASPQMPRAPVLRSSATAERGEARGASLEERENLVCDTENGSEHGISLSEDYWIFVHHKG